MQETTGSFADNLERLNPAEREVLTLLAHGHTAKSIAALTGRSVGAVNERLREARRKTGVGSSRELARRLLVRKNGAEEVGVAAGTAPGAAPAEGAPPPVAGARTRGGLIMAALLIAVAGAGALAFLAPDAPAGIPAPASQAAEAPQDAFSERFLLGEEMPDSSRLHAQILSEERDPAAEAALREIYGRVPHVNSAEEPLHVRCSTSLCEIAGVFDVPSQPTGEPAPAALEKAVAMLQSRELNSAVTARGFTYVMTRFGPAPSGSHPIFVAYWRRTA